MTDFPFSLGALRGSLLFSNRENLKELHAKYIRILCKTNTKNTLCFYISCNDLCKLAPGKSGIHTAIPYPLRGGLSMPYVQKRRKQSHMTNSSNLSQSDGARKAKRLWHIPPLCLLPIDCEQMGATLLKAE